MNILEQANEITGNNGDRRKSYGDPRESFNRIAGLWTSYMNNEVTFTRKDVAMFMILLKVSRHKNSTKKDDLVDIAGYARTAEEVDDISGLFAEEVA